jgi:hypothetical protein
MRQLVKGGKPVKWLRIAVRNLMLMGPTNCCLRCDGCYCIHSIINNKTQQRQQCRGLLHRRHVFLLNDECPRREEPRRNIGNKYCRRRFVLLQLVVARRVARKRGAVVSLTARKQAPSRGRCKIKKSVLYPAFPRQRQIFVVRRRSLSSERRRKSADESDIFVGILSWAFGRRQQYADQRTPTPMNAGGGPVDNKRSTLAPACIGALNKKSANR